MSTRAAMLLCLLVIGCTQEPSALVTDAGPREVAASPSIRARVAPDFDAHSWIVRHMKSRPAHVNIPMRDAGPMRGITPVPQLPPDGGVITAEKPPDVAISRDAGTLPQPQPQPDEEDAGSEEPCDSVDCLCGRICERGLALECPEDDPFDACVEQCGVVIPDCYEQLLRLLRCSAALPDAAYSCDPDIEVFFVEGCVPQTSALQTCSRI